MKHTVKPVAATRRFRTVALVTALAIAAVIPPAAASFGAASAPASVKPVDLGIVQAYVAGDARRAEFGQTLTFVFTAKNFGPGVGDVSIDLVSVAGIDQQADTSSENCVLPNGTVINADTPSCEPGQFGKGRSAGSLVFTGVVDGTSDVIVRACTSDLGGANDPRASNDCRTLVDHGGLALRRVGELDRRRRRPHLGHPGGDD